jgi:hypothetical protein
MSKEDSENLVSIYKTDNPAIIALVKSMLDEAQIEYMAKDDDVAGVYPINAFPVDFMVMPDNAEFARELLKDINPNGSDEPDSEESDEGTAEGDFTNGEEKSE